MVEFCDKGLLLPLNEYADSGVLDFSQVSEDAKSTLTRDGNLYGIILGSIAGAMSYDPDVVKEAGVEIYDVKGGKIKWEKGLLQLRVWKRI